MLFELKSIIESLPRYWIAEDCPVMEDQKISSACVLPPNTDFLQKDILYVTTASQLQEIPGNSIPVNLACISDTPLPQELLNQGCSIVPVKPPYSPEEIVSAVNTFIDLTGARRLQENYEKLIHALSYGKGLQAITDIGSEILENPVAIADTSFKLLAATESYRNSFKRREIVGSYGTVLADSILAGQLGAASIGFFKSSKRYEQCVNMPQPHIIDKEAMLQLGLPSPYDFLDCGVRIKGVFVAYLSVADADRPFQPGDLEYCRQLSNLVALELQKNEFFIHNHGIAYETLLYDLLENQINDGLQIRLRLQSMDKELKSELRVITIRRIVSTDNESAIPVVGQSAVRRFFPDCISVIYKNDIVLLVSKDTGNPLEIDTSEDFPALLEANHMKAGISEVFYDPIKMRKYYQQSVKAIELGMCLQPDRLLLYYYQLSVFHAMEICARTISLRDLCHPVIASLNSSKKESDKDLLKTLYLWLHYERDTARISDMLHIHKSTLFYRLNKIKDMIGGDLYDGDLIFQLKFSFKLIQYYSGFVDQSEEYWFKHVPQE